VRCDGDGNDDTSRPFVQEQGTMEMIKTSKPVRKSSAILTWMICTEAKKLLATPRGNSEILILA
jgi:hypothetical protein